MSVITRKENGVFFFPSGCRVFTKEASFMAAHSKERFVYLAFMTRTYSLSLSPLSEITACVPRRRAPAVPVYSENSGASDASQSTWDVYDFDRIAQGGLDSRREFSTLSRADTLTPRHTVPLPSGFGRKGKTRVRLKCLDVKPRRQ